MVYTSLKNSSSITGDELCPKLINMITGYISGSSPHIRSGAVSALSALIYKDPEICLSSLELLLSILSLLHTKSIETIKAVLGFVKVLVSTSQAQDLQDLLQNLLIAPGYQKTKKKQTLRRLHPLTQSENRGKETTEKLQKKQAKMTGVYNPTNSNDRREYMNTHLLPTLMEAEQDQNALVTEASGNIEKHLETITSQETEASGNIEKHLETVTSQEKRL